MLRHINTIWLLLATFCLGIGFLYTDWLTRDSIAGFLSDLGPMAFTAYILLSLSRAILLIPCTPFVLAGAISFPQWPFSVFIVSLAGIVVGSYLIYSFPSFGGYDKFLEERYPVLIKSLKRRMHGKYSFWIVSGWSLFPLVPTDAVCYVAGMAKMPLRKLLSGVILGELPLVTIYVFLGAEIGVWLRV